MSFWGSSGSFFFFRFVLFMAGLEEWFSRFVYFLLVDFGRKFRFFLSEFVLMREYGKKERGGKVL